ncbi:MAG: twin-arginine translocase TatA/TatE family subunit [Vampirovibrio sp.]|nr:twin-arginine translocase TatA/TatE family subunit [Vampirovibrio sp.]
MPEAVFHPFLLFIPSLGIAELSVIFVIVLILFGPGKLPDFCRALGDGIKQFKNAVSDEKPAGDEKLSDNQAS